MHYLWARKCGYNIIKVSKVKLISPQWDIYRFADAVFASA